MNQSQWQKSQQEQQNRSACSSEMRKAANKAKGKGPKNNKDDMLPTRNSNSEANFIDDIVENKAGNSRFDEYASVF